MNKKALRYSREYVKSQCGIRLSHEEVHEELYKMLVKFDNFCRAHHITYYLAWGTLLGAVRHQDFIPWDDDVDVLVPRKDYERLLKFKRIDKDTDIVSLKHDAGYYHPYTYCNIADKKTIMIEENAKAPTGKGLFIDVFPFDGVPDNKLKRFFHLMNLMCLRVVYRFTTKPVKKIENVTDVFHNLFVRLFDRIDEIALADKIDMYAKKYDISKCKLTGYVLSGSFRKFSWPSADFEGMLEMKFRDSQFFVPSGYDYMLKKSYGDYMKLPPEEDRVGHHGIQVYRRMQV